MRGKPAIARVLAMGIGDDERVTGAVIDVKSPAAQISWAAQ